MHQRVFHWFELIDLLHGYLAEKWDARFIVRYHVSSIIFRCLLLDQQVHAAAHFESKWHDHAVWLLNQKILFDPKKREKQNHPDRNVNEN